MEQSFLSYAVDDTVLDYVPRAQDEVLVLVHALELCLEYPAVSDGNSDVRTAEPVV